LLSFTVTAVPLWADSKEEIKQEKADIRNMAKETFMKMIELQAGFGVGIKKFRLVWVFENHKDVTE
jgi:hypothetical protein